MLSTISDALAEKGYETLTEVQQAVCAPELADADLLVSAQTGSGKTVGFGLAIAPTLLGEDPRFGPPAAPLALIIAPTRELAMQVARELEWLYGKAGARIVTNIGGMDARNERRALERGAHVVVGTPGRLRDHITRGALDLSEIRAIVLDEADEMLDLGFREDLEFMLGEAPETRRTLLFSATVPPSIEGMAKQFQRDAVRVSTVSGKAQHSDISYQAVQVAARDSENAIINLLRFHDSQTSIVFANTRAAVARLTARFSNRGFQVVSLSGELSQDERSHALQALRDGRARVCVATDVAARGIDLPNLELVIHADLPINTEALLHRSGRTGRAGRKGISALIVGDRDVKKAQRLLRWAKIEAEWTFAPSPEAIREKDEARLLSDPVWSDERTEEETAFAAKLLEMHGPEAIAAACLRLYQGRLSAPEELNQPPVRGERGEREERAPMGPSVWFELSVGRNRNAEPRWLLPLLCRAGGLDKANLGKIRVQDEVSYVEIAEAAADDLEAHLGENGVLEDDIRATRLAELPEDALKPRPRPQRPERGERPPRKGPRPERFGEGPRTERAPREEAGDDEAPRERKPRWNSDDRAQATERPREDRPRRDFGDKPKRAYGDKPAGRSYGDKPKRPYGDKPAGKSFGDKPKRAYGDKPAGKPYGDKPNRPYGDKPAGKSYGDKPNRPYGDKPAGKPAPRNFGDASQSFRKKPGGKPNFKGKGGDVPPRRKG
ncbi:DEAD/DEAH box helicase [Pseudooceanicola sp. CBS1P-1]|uniref:DEAD/DEAH box helicase n=1 Tax=Pseudooceanicola albus TaxID=2692189 RepID=A0A6L7G6B7_9RHOB|nr:MULTISPECIES: DEAD/DEAH box helicase [Pseudooceanicola]MBT9383034.1 DEAD/DEAH box helicase [Pseudooceanicola endophyticus]MXN19222.1 DEAD/DEAH box helicase [Pseudooceanicola albus]